MGGRSCVVIYQVFLFFSFMMMAHHFSSHEKRQAVFVGTVPKKTGSRGGGRGVPRK